MTSEGNDEYKGQSLVEIEEHIKKLDDVMQFINTILIEFYSIQP